MIQNHMHRLSFWAILSAVTILAVFIALWSPLLGVALVGASFTFALVRSIPGVAILLLFSGPLLGTRVQVGSITLDNALTLAGLAVGSFWAVSQKRLPFTLLGAFPLAMSIAIGASALASATSSGPAVIRYLGLAALAGLVILCRTSIPLARVHAIAMTVILIAALSVLLQPISTVIPAYRDPDTGILRYGGFVGHPNFAACVMAITVLYLLARGSWSMRSFIFIGVLLAAILTTGSLGALAALVAAVLVFVLRSARWIAVSLTVGGLVFFFAGTSLISRLESLSNNTTGQNSLTWRFQRWTDALGLAPGWNVFGVGWEQIETSLGGPAHSSYIAIYVELGLLGAVAAAIGLAVTIFNSRREKFTFALILFVLVSSATDPVVYYPATAVTWMMTLAIRRAELSATQQPLLTARSELRSKRAQLRRSLA